MFPDGSNAVKAYTKFNQDKMVNYRSSQLFTYAIRNLVGLRDFTLQDQNEDLLDLDAALIRKVTLVVIGLVDGRLKLIAREGAIV